MFCRTTLHYIYTLLQVICCPTWPNSDRTTFFNKAPIHLIEDIVLPNKPFLVYILKQPVLQQYHCKLLKLTWKKIFFTYLIKSYNGFLKTITANIVLLKIVNRSFTETIVTNTVNAAIGNYNWTLYWHYCWISRIRMSPFEWLKLCGLVFLCLFPN